MIVKFANEKQTLIQGVIKAVLVINVNVASSERSATAPAHHTPSLSPHECNRQNDIRYHQLIHSSYCYGLDRLLSSGN